MLLVETVFLAIEKQFFPSARYSWLCKQFLTSSSFRFVETDFLSSEKSILLFKGLFKFLKFGVSNFLRETLFLLVETVFWLMEVGFFHFSDTPASESYFSSSGNVFLTEFFILYGGDGFCASTSRYRHGN